ncbi:AB hydrolase superfamily protein YfhM [Adhaeribacter aerolatus]|uniref:AB hydrolase superfamily protein YfhM n=1 Tax=Adhaeribacter aerolatus TaxID=670289 RepID=A0A512AZ75_9BACT|nr:alpha/beta hydrolase [Adhaeribacter aerolatus]GEO05010.1 AB hydrolase superfamily protein YfhM [Adhaeribacter aerolatus]
MRIREKLHEVNGIYLNAAEAGDPDGKVIIFLHGFPEHWYAWHQQLPFFGDKGYRAMAPDQRGYNRSSKPAGVKAYTLPHLTADVVSFIRRQTTDKIILVGHDWGGAVAWAVAAQYPKLLEKLVILNMPHPEVFHNYLRRHPKQLFKSMYAAFFQLPFLPEISNRAFNYKLLKTTLQKSALKYTFSKEDFLQYKEAWRKPGALKAMLNWYRAYKYHPYHSPEPITVPTLILWGKKDSFLSAEMATPSKDKCRNGELVFLPNATHWLHHENPHQINNLIYKFIQ